MYDYPSVLVLSNAHNHSLQCAQSLQQLRLTEKTRQSLFRLFDSGLSAGQVYRLLQTDMVCEDISNMANNNITPKLNSIYYKWHLWKNDTFGNYSGDELFQAMEEYAQKVDATISVKRVGSNYVCGIVTPFMMRVHEYVPEANEMVFVDTTSHIDQTNSSLTIMLCRTQFGALPLDCFISSAQDEFCYLTGKFYGTD